MGFVGHDDNVVVRIDRFHVGFIELLDQRKDKAGVALELTDQVTSAGGDELAGFGFP